MLLFSQTDDGYHIELELTLSELELTLSNHIDIDYYQLKIKNINSGYQSFTFEKIIEIGGLRNDEIKNKN